MKKYAIAYFILFLILLGLGLTHGISFGITVSELDFSYAFYPEIIRNIMLIPVIMFICFLFLPVGMSEDVRIIPPEHTKEFWSFISLMMR